MERIRVLIFPSGSEGALDIYHSLRYNLRFDVYGLSGKENYTDYAYPEGKFIYGDERLFVDHPEFENALTAVIERLKIQYIIPTFDNVALKLSELRSRLRAKVITSPYETLLAASDKRRMYKDIVGMSFAPKVFHGVDEVSKYPVFIKPAKGTGSRGARKVCSRNELELAIEATSEPVITEYLTGEEISVDCFTDRFGVLRFIGPRVRARVWNGISFRARTIPVTGEIEEIASALNERFVFRGAWFFQAKRDVCGKYKLLEFSARQATNSSLYTKLGINFSLLSLFDAMEYDVKIIPNDCQIEQERCLRAAYRIDFRYSVVYIDFDDTLIIENRVNTNLMRFIYQCVNMGKKVVLLTRHMHDLEESLVKHRIAKLLFNQIIWIKDDTPKWEYIQENDAILIDNYFKEREEVQRLCGIPVFDVDAVDCLISECQL